MPKRNPNRRRRGNSNVVALAKNDFLKCAFAPVDFNNEKQCPIPDMSGARVVVKRHKALYNIQTTPGGDTYLAIMPTPGTAYLSLNVTSGTFPGSGTAFTPIEYADSAALFPSGAASLNFSKFRHISNYVELVPTINATSWSGSVTVWKAAVEIGSEYSSVAGNVATTLAGFQSAGTVGQSMYVAGNNLGVYATAAQVGPWTYNEIFAALPSLNADAGTNSASINNRIMGVGNLETIFIRLTGNFSYTMKVGCCVEYVVSTNSVLYEYSAINNVYDPAALMAYKMIASDLPVAVNYFENAQFWDRVLQIIRTLSGALSILPGPAGMAAQGVNLISNAITSYVQ